MAKLPTQDLKFCSERGRLTDLMSQAAVAYSTAAKALSLIMSTLPKPAYRLCKLSVDRARLDAENARQALLKHREEHGC